MAAPGYTVTFSGVTVLTIPGSVHGLGTAALLYQLYDAATPHAAFEPGSFSVDASTFAVTVGFSSPTSGTLVLFPADVASQVVPPPVVPVTGGTGSSGLDPWLLAMLTETVQHQAYTGQDGYGASEYGPVILRACRVEAKVQRVPMAQGDERTSTTRIFFGTDFTLELRDRLVLEDGTAPQIQRVTLHRDEWGTPHHQTALL